MNNAIVITGGASGIGAATIDRLQTSGRRIINLDLHASPAADVTNIPCDLTDPAAIDAAITRLPDAFETLIHVAGVAPGLVPDEAIMAVNFLGLRHLTESAFPHIVRGGRMLIVASSAGRDWHTRRESVHSLLDTADFPAGKAWLAEHPDRWQGEAYKFSKQCAAAYTYRAAGLGRERAIRVNCVNPGIVDTRLSPQFRDMLGQDRYDWIVGQTGRAGTPADVAQIIEFLAIGACDWLNGVEITVDGGYFAGTLGGWINPDEMP